MTNYKSTIYLLLLFGYIFFFAYNIPYFSNDFRYMMIEGTDELVKNPIDIFVSQYRHYFTWGGRTPAHLLAQFLLLGGKFVSSFAIAFCFVSIIYLYVSHAKGRLENPLRLPLTVSIIASIFIYICMRNLGEVVFMLVSSCNYMFTTAFVLAFLLPYTFAITSKEKTNKNVLFSILMFVLGVIAGWCNENTGFAICSVTFLYLVYMYVKKKLALYQVTGFLGMCTGFLLLVLSPGNAARMASMNAVKPFDYYAHLFVAFDIFILSLLENLPLILSLAFLVYKAVKNKLVKKYKEDFVVAAYLFLIGFASLFIMIFSPNFPARAASAFTIFAVASLIKVYLILKRENIRIVSKVSFYVLCSISLVFFVYTANNAVHSMFVAKEQLAQREIFINEQIKNGVKDIVVEPLNVRSDRYIFINDVRKDNHYFSNQILARFYHINSIVRSCDFEGIKPHYDIMLSQNYEEPVCKIK